MNNSLPRHFKRSELQRVDVFQWRDAIASADGPRNPVVRLVLLIVSLHMAKDGTGAWPSQTLIGRRAGVSLSSVKRHLCAAEQCGWLIRRERNSASGRRLRTSYEAVVPLGVTVTPINGAKASHDGVSVTPTWCHGDPSLVSQATDVGVKLWPDNSSENSTKNLGAPLRAGRSKVSGPDSDRERLKLILEALTSNPDASDAAISKRVPGSNVTSVRICRERLQRINGHDQSNVKRA